MRRAIRTSVVPVLLGLDGASYRIAFELFWRYGIISNIFAQKRTLASYFTPFISFYTLPLSQNGEFIIMSLEKFCTEVGEITFLLIPCNDFYEKFVEKNRTRLESRFIIRRADEIGERLFPITAVK